MEKLLATCVSALAAVGREDLSEGLRELAKLAAVMSRRSLVMRVDGEAIAEAVEEMADELNDRGLRDLGVETQTLVGWLNDLGEAVADFPPTVRGPEEAARARARLREVLDRGGDPDAAVDLRAIEPALSLLLREAAAL